MAYPYAATSSSGNMSDEVGGDPPGLAVLAPGQVARPLNVRVPTTVRVTQLPVPDVMKPRRTPEQMESYRSMEHARKNYKVDTEDMPDRIQRIQASFQPPAPPTLPDPEPENYREEVSVNVGPMIMLGLVCLAGGFLIYSVLKPGAVASNVVPAA